VSSQLHTNVTAEPQDRGIFGGIVTADGSSGVDLSLTVDNAFATTHVDYGPAPQPHPVAGPKGDAGVAGAPGASGHAGADGAAGAPGPKGEAAPITTVTTSASPCAASGRTLSCVLAGKALQASRLRGGKATLYRAGRPVASGSVRVAGGRVQLRLGRRVAAGRYDLVLTRTGRRLAHQSVLVAG
jgi:hypothetical protein